MGNYLCMNLYQMVIAVLPVRLEDKYVFHIGTINVKVNVCLAKNTQTQRKQPT